MERGYRDPMTFRKLPVSDSMAVTRHVMTMEKMSAHFRNVEMHQYIHELMQGKDPWESEWFKSMEKVQ